ncbi:hypothetical protein DFH09DRAFT_1369921 [Mycena vulgaris]|nr:hypothetical protein DFH09DRAFT_1369921 [Mycena vulgaris]
MQEFVVLPYHLYAAATIPDDFDFVTVFFILFDQLSLPYAIRLLRTAGYTNVMATASMKHHASLNTLCATSVLDYSRVSLAADVAVAVGGDGKIARAPDSISALGTLARVAPLIRAQSTVAVLMPIKGADTVAVGSAGLLAEIPPVRNSFPPETKIVYVRTFFTYRESE